MNRQSLPALAAAVLALATLSACTSPAAHHAAATPTTRPAQTVAPTPTQAAVQPSAPPTSASPAPAPSPTPTPTTDPAPPTADPAAPPTAPAAGRLDVVLTFAGSSDGGRTYTVAATVGGVIEDGGTCTFDLVGPGGTVTRTQSGLADATSTSCGSVTFAPGDLAPGTWAAHVSYHGRAGQGVSPTSTLEVR